MRDCRKQGPSPGRGEQGPGVHAPLGCPCSVLELPLPGEMALVSAHTTDRQMDGLLLEGLRGPPAGAMTTKEGAAVTKARSSQRDEAFSGDTAKGRERGSRYKVFPFRQYLLTGRTEQGADGRGIREM